MVRRKARLFERNHGNAGIPYGRNAWLHANGVVFFDFKARKFVDFAQGQGIIRTMAKRHQRENGVHHRRVNGREAFGALDMIQHPGLGFSHGALPERLPGRLLIKLQTAVQGQENVFPGTKLITPIQRGGLALRILEQFVDVGGLRQPPVGAQHTQNRHGDHDAARPRRHFVNVENEPMGDKH